MKDKCADGCPRGCPHDKTTKRFPITCPDCRQPVAPVGPGTVGPWTCQECDAQGHGGCFTNTDDSDVLCQKCRKGKGVTWAVLCDADAETHSGEVRRYWLKKEFQPWTGIPWCDECAASAQDMIKRQGTKIIGHMGAA